MTELIGIGPVVKVLKEIVEEYGQDHVYEEYNGNCMYAEEDGSPSCIVGHVMHRMTPDYYNEVVEAERIYGAAGVTEIGHAGMCGYAEDDEAIPRTADMVFSPEALVLLARAQIMQDTGNPWGISVDHSIEFVGYEGE